MNARFFMYLLTLLCILVAFSFAPWDEVLCRSDYVSDVLALKNKDGAANCAEFWFNRYQTLFAALIALGAALLGAYLANDQLNAAREQARAAKLQTLISSYEFWSVKYAAINEIWEMYFPIEAAWNAASPILDMKFGHWPDREIIKYYDEFKAVAKQFDIITQKYRFITGNKIEAPDKHQIIMHHIDFVMMVGNTDKVLFERRLEMAREIRYKFRDNGLLHDELAIKGEISFISKFLSRIEKEFIDYGK